MKGPNKSIETKSYVVELQIICLYSQTGNSKCFEASFASVDGASVDAL